MNTSGPVVVYDLYFKAVDGTTWSIQPQFGSTPGPTGPQGPQGLTGPSGPSGNNGKSVSKVEVVPDGSDSNGNYYLLNQYLEGESTPVPIVEGGSNRFLAPIGPQGIQGVSPSKILESIGLHLNNNEAFFYPESGRIYVINVLNGSPGMFTVGNKSEEANCLYIIRNGLTNYRLKCFFISYNGNYVEADFEGYTRISTNSQYIMFSYIRT